MKTWTLLLLTAVLFACQPKPSEFDQVATAPVVQADSSAADTPASQEETTTTTEREPGPYDQVLGSYVGMFEAKTYDSEQDISWANRITVFLDSIVDGKLYGRSVVAGNARPFEGTFEERGTSYRATGREPGDDRYDGEFFFTIARNGQSLEGTWKANRKLPVSERQYELKRRSFSYDPSQELTLDVAWADLYGTYDEETEEYEMVTEAVTGLNPSTDRLTKTDVENLYGGDLEVIRNSIYARHGYSFKNRRMRYIFDSYVDWYMPVSTDIRSKLTDLEKANIELLKRYEQHADRYYDVFGR